MPNLWNVQGRTIGYVERVRAFGNDYSRCWAGPQWVYRVNGVMVECTQSDACTCGECGSFLPTLFA